MDKLELTTISRTKPTDFGTGFILLSKIAKEKKYAQEYLGLLARRGDLGSIRMGKRWYTTSEWFENFLSDTEKRKEELKAQMMEQETKETKEAVAVNSGIKKEVNATVAINKVIEKPKEIFQVTAMESSIVVKREEVEIYSENQVPFKTAKPEEIKDPALEEVSLSLNQESSRVNISIPRKITRSVISQKREFIEIKRPDLNSANNMSRIVKVIQPVFTAQNHPRNFIPSSFSGGTDLRKASIQRKSFAGNMAPRTIARRQPVAMAFSAKKQREFFIPEEKQNQKIQSSKKIIFEKSIYNYSPSFTENVRSISHFFQKLAFSSALVLLFAILSAGVILYKKDSANFPKAGSGMVAGAEDARLAGVSSMENLTSSYFEARRGQTKENISLSRVILEAAIEKNQQQ